MTYEIIETKTDKENGVELRLAKIDTGYSVGVWDLDAGAYYPQIRIFPHGLEGAEEKAKTYFLSQSA